MSDTLPDRIFLNETARRESLAAATWFAQRNTRHEVELSSDAEPRISGEFAETMSSLLRAIGSGRTVTIGALPDELTTTVAAQQIGVSRPTLMKWIRDGELPAHKVGSHTRVKTSDLIALRLARANAQRQALEELLALEDRLNID